MATPIAAASQQGTKRGAEAVADTMEAELRTVKKATGELAEQMPTETMPDTKDKKATPEKVRIGPEKHHYVYTRLTNVAYKCRRGSDYARAGHVLFLSRTSSGQWIAYDGPDSDDSAMPPMLDPTFTSYEDVLLEGPHTWRMEKWGGRESSFKTTVL